MFFLEALPLARRASAATGVLTSVILAQWADETAYGTSNDWTVKHNPGNVSPGGVVATYPSLDAGVNAYILTMNGGLYQAVKQAFGWQAQCIALGRSPWASGHYDDGSGPGSALIAIITANQLWQYDRQKGNTDVRYIIRIPNGGEFYEFIAGKLTHLDGATSQALTAEGVQVLNITQDEATALGLS